MGSRLYCMLCQAEFPEFTKWKRLLSLLLFCGWAKAPGDRCPEASRPPNLRGFGKSQVQGAVPGVGVGVGARGAAPPKLTPP